MAGNNSTVGLETVTFTDNMSFDGTERGGAMTTNGELWIGSTAPRHVKKGTLTSPLGTIAIGYSDPDITLDLVGTQAAIDSITVDASTPPGTNPVLPNVSGNVTITGAQVATGTIGANVIRTDSLALNSLTVEIQRTTTSSSANQNLNGVSHFDSASFSVAATGFVTMSGGGGFTWNDVSGAFSPLKNNGYFITGTATGTLPASPAQGDTIKFFVDHASQLLTIDAPGTQIIRLGNQVTSAGGTFVSTAQGDSVELTYRASDTCWCAIAGFTGTWNFT